MTTITTILGKCSFILINIEDYQMLITCISKKKKKRSVFDWPTEDIKQGLFSF